MPQRSGMILSQLNKKVLRRIVNLFLEHTGIEVNDGTFRYTAKDIKRQLGFGGDFSYGFGHFFKLVFVRFGTKRSDKGTGGYDILFHLAVELDNMSNTKKDDKLYRVRRRIADEAEGKLEEYLKENGLAMELPSERPDISGEGSRKPRQ